MRRKHSHMLQRPSFKLPGLGRIALAALTLAAVAWATPTTVASAAEPAACLSDNPSDWPASSRPYFMIIVDTSGSMTSSVSSNNSCGYPNDRMGHARCAVKNTVQAFGEVNFGLAGFAFRVNCTNASNVTCYGTKCSAEYAPNDWGPACGPSILDSEMTANNTTPGKLATRGANIFVPMRQDNYWSGSPVSPNVDEILKYVDNSCGSTNTELGAASNTPLGGALFSAYQYFKGDYKDLFTNASIASPLTGTERGCRSVNVILITDGDETCNSGTDPRPIAGGCRSGSTSYLDNAGERLASYEADKMNTLGVTVGGQNFKIKTHVIGFAGASTTALNNIANCGGTGSAYSTSNEAQLSNALASIVAGAIRPESCDNTDNNCNGCTDEGFSHYRNVSQTCCSWTTESARQACLTTYKGTITSSNPSGDVTKLPCTTAAQQDNPLQWLCYDPKDRCDGVDNNGDGVVDELQLKCGSPAHCPTTEVCNGVDDNCDGQVDEDVCGTCVPTPEVCDGCDNDCDGVVDDGVFPTVSCGLDSPANCKGTASCQAPVGSVSPGACLPGKGYTACNNSPQGEICDGVDNNCNGLIDDGLGAADCVPAGTSPTLVYGGTSQCKKGKQACGGTCVGFVGPTAEVCDGVDNDCDGSVDEGVIGVGTSCGNDVGECSGGVIACVSGILTCSGGTGPVTELCDGKDNDCDGTIDNGLAVGGACPAVYDTTMYPGDRSKGACFPGTLACAITGGDTVCNGGVGPSPEVCDGIDNDCDGQVDEVGAAPDGVDGTSDPATPGGPLVGTDCGGDSACGVGKYACVNGKVTCIGSKVAQPEACDCEDNDCDGNIDNPNSNGPPLCGSGKTCVKSSFGCQCALPCNGDVGCPTGQVCQGVTNSMSGEEAGRYCVADACGDCSAKTVKDSSGKVICAPEGSQDACVNVPECVCKGQSGCQDPCAGVACDSGQTCITKGPKAGTCGLDNCYSAPCQGCDRVCNLGSCVDSPCKPDSCAADEACKPSANFATFTCVKSCVGVTCEGGEVCRDGACVPTCATACGAGEVCDDSADPPACVTDKCAGSPCTDGSYCNPVTGACGNDVCEGVLCPVGQLCNAGQCEEGTTTGAGGSTGSGAGGEAPTSSTGAGASGPSVTSGGGSDRGAWGLPTGGGGCSCTVGESGGSRDVSGFALLGLALGAMVMRRRRTATEASARKDEVA